METNKRGVWKWLGRRTGDRAAVLPDNKCVALLASTDALVYDVPERPMVRSKVPWSCHRACRSERVPTPRAHGELLGDLFKSFFFVFVYFSATQGPTTTTSGRAEKSFFLIFPRPRSKGDNIRKRGNIVASLLDNTQSIWPTYNFRQPQPRLI